LELVVPQKVLSPLALHADLLCENLL